jgi:BirA family biotin operon repressor/biotin-[acetyl-CoA-carboxylase] ligase
MTGAIAIERWASRIESGLAAHAARVGRVIVLAETDSTQDAARRMAGPGDLVVAARQRAGRGRLGRPWRDAAGEGVALTLVLAPLVPERLAVASAVAVAWAVEELAARSVGIKWPNDVVIGGRKMAGILIERCDGRALVGIGLNVNQAGFPPELEGRAASLRQIRGDADPLDRVPVVVALVAAVDRALDLDDAALVREFARRDVLGGSVARFSSPSVRAGPIEGRVVGIDPLQGLEIAVEGGPATLWLPASTTSVLETVGDR